jgi:hypothetical protein
MTAVVGTAPHVTMEEEKCEVHVSCSEPRLRICPLSLDKEENISSTGEPVVTRKELWSYYRKQLAPMVLVLLIILQFT